ncbi:MAG TPA: ATP-binding protein [Steroidobacteraceae bacterium]|nr:ATP-binding protein [Steroidobacteraceae bacterium]
MVGELSGAIAHELNQPLTAILSNAQAAQRMLSSDGVNPREVYDILSDIVSEDKRAVLVIERLRALLTKDPTDAQIIDLAELTQEVLALAHSAIVAGKVTVAARLTPGVPFVLADRVQIQQVLLNLILNANEAMVSAKDGEQRRLSIATTLANDGGVLVSVSDTGCGIPADAIGRIFDSFYTTKARGLGLGLSISKMIVEAHGGRIWALNNSGAGATVCFTLPSSPPTRPRAQMGAAHATPIVPP